MLSEWRCTAEPSGRDWRSLGWERQIASGRNLRCAPGMKRWLRKTRASSMRQSPSDDTELPTLAFQSVNRFAICGAPDSHIAQSAPRVTAAEHPWPLPAPASPTSVAHSPGCTSQAALRSPTLSMWAARCTCRISGLRRLRPRVPASPGRRADAPIIESRARQCWRTSSSDGRRHRHVPLNADFESGFATDAAGVAESVRLAVASGVAGLSIEDSTGIAARPLFEIDEAVARVRAARRAIDQAGGDTLLVGRAECFLVGRPDLAETIARLKGAYARRPVPTACTRRACGHAR